MNNMPYFVIDVYQRDSAAGSQPVRRHFVRQDNYFIGQTEHLDNQGRLHKRQTYHDLKAVDGEMWRSGMILMEDVKEQHQSLLKVTRRWFSHDYVPSEIFTAEWLFENHPYIEPLTDEEMIELDPDSASESAADEQLSQVSAEEMIQP